MTFLCVYDLSPVVLHALISFFCVRIDVQPEVGKEKIAKMMCSISKSMAHNARQTIATAHYKIDKLMCNIQTERVSCCMTDPCNHALKDGQVDCHTGGAPHCKTDKGKCALQD